MLTGGEAGRGDRDDGVADESRGGLSDALRGRPGPALVRLVTGLGLAAFGLLLVAVLGALSVKDDPGRLKASASGGPESVTGAGPGGADEVLGATDPGAAAGPAGAVGPGSTGLAGGPAAAGPGSTAAGAVGSTAATAGPQATVAITSTPGADRTGVTATSIRWAVHAPKTFGGAPVNLAADPLKGVDTYLKAINDAGGVNGRKIDYQVFDDTYTVSGANTASKKAIDEYKPFFLSGTLGVDQIYVFADLARRRNVPYLAGGGSEGPFKNIGMYQVAASYDSHLEALASYLAAQSKTQGSPYFGLTKVGVSRLDSPYLAPSVEETFKNALSSRGLSLVKVVTVKKPTDQTTYQTQIAELRGAGAQIVVPAQDPITTSREVKECAPATNDRPTANCPWKWAFSDFAHDGDVDLKLMGGAWTGVRGLSGACYYQAPARDDQAKCAQMGTAHTQWVKYNGEADWNDHGSGGSVGYQLTHIWLKALKDAGSDPTRERFRAALNTYSGYTDLVSGPITYAGSSNISHGATKFAVLEAQTTQTYRQISDGLGGF